MNKSSLTKKHIILAAILGFFVGLSTPMLLSIITTEETDLKSLGDPNDPCSTSSLVTRYESPQSLKSAIENGTETCKIPDTVQILLDNIKSKPLSGIIHIEP